MKDRQVPIPDEELEDAVRSHRLAFLQGAQAAVEVCKPVRPSVAAWLALVEAYASPSSDLPSRWWEYDTALDALEDDVPKFVE